ncbi:MAG: hypothetical protein RIS34_819 [Pseudomonadota bacterium]
MSTIKKKPLVNPPVKTTATVRTKVVTKPATKVPAKAAVKLKAERLIKVKKPKLVRDSFTIPKPEYAVLEELKQRTIRLGNSAKKSELLRAGIKALAAMSDGAFADALKAVPAIKTGRPAKA